MQKIYEVRDGRVFCPECRRLGRYSVIAYILPETDARHAIFLCRRCKRRYVVNVKNGRVCGW